MNSQNVAESGTERGVPDSASIYDTAAPVGCQHPACSHSVLHDSRKDF